MMDCDLQDRPEDIPALFSKALEGYDVVFARKTKSKESTVTRFLSKSFYKFYGYITNTDCDSNIRRRQVIESYCKMREHSRAYRMFIQWLGFKQTFVEVDCDERYSGESSYNFKRKLKMSMQVITSQSNKPLFIVAKIGLLMSFLAGLFVLYLVIRRVIDPNIEVGWTSIVASIYFVGGLLLCAIGVVGIYIGNIFEEVKQRPLYIVRETINFEKEKIE